MVMQQQQEGLIAQLTETEEDFLVYLGEWCPYCVAAKRLLTEKGITFRSVDLDHQPELRRELVQTTGHRTIPMIFDLREEQPVFVGGFDQLSVYL